MQFLLREAADNYSVGGQLTKVILQHLKVRAVIYNTIQYFLAYNHPSLHFSVIHLLMEFI